MKKMRSIAVVMICVLLLGIFPLRAFAAGKIMPGKDVAVTISYKDSAKAIPNARFNLYKVMNVDEYVRMTLTPEFEPYKNIVHGLTDLENMDQAKWLELAGTLKGYVHRDGVTPSFSGKTDETGAISLSTKPGLYLVIGYRATTADYYTYSATPFMLFLPGEDAQNNDWDYSVTVSPKFDKSYNPPDEPDPVITRKVLKVWDDAGYESRRPAEVFVQLLCDGEIYDTVTLNSGNNWRHAWDNLEEKHEWLVVEKEVPGYEVTQRWEGITFIITNNYIEPVIPEELIAYKQITGGTPRTASEFIFVLTAKDAANPMPGGSIGLEKQISVMGEGSVQFGGINFTEAGTYIYTVHELNTKVKGYTYDKTVYTVFYTITQKDGELLVDRVIRDSKANIVEKMVFTNKFKKLPQTGVLWWPVPILLLVGVTLVVTGIKRRKEWEK